jgi:hypothetical protein
MSRANIGYQIGNMRDNEHAIAGTASGRGPSPKLWSGCPLLPIMLDPTKGFYFFDDFVKPGAYATGAIQSGLLFTQCSSGGTVANAPTLAGGILQLTAPAVESDGPTCQWPGMQVTPAAGTKIWFECRVKIATDVEDVLIGLVDDATTDPINAGAIVTDQDMAVFFRDDGTTDAAMGTQVGDGDSVDTEDDTISDVDYTAYEKFGILIDGVSTVTFFHNGEPIRVVSDADDICDAEMCPTIQITTDAGAAGGSVYVDWMRVAVYNSTNGGRES